MISNGEFVSRVVNGLKALTKDSHVSARYILGIGKVKSKFLMAQKLDELTLFKEEGLITNIDCFRLDRIKSRDCGIVEFTLCDNLMKSCEKIPEGLFGKIGPSIFSVTSVDGSVDYRYITPRRYSDIKKRKYRKSGAGYFYVKDDYLYLPDSKNELVDISMVTLDIDKAAEVSECSGVKCDPCKSKFDSTFVCPDRFLDLVVRETIQEVGTFYRTSVEDENPNLDSNQKTKTQQ
jgi:hypothetical protein